MTRMNGETGRTAAARLGRAALLALWALLAAGASAQQYDSQGNPVGGQRFSRERPAADRAPDRDVPPPSLGALGGLVPAPASSYDGPTPQLAREQFQVGADEVVRYVLVMRLSDGTREVTWEGIRCGPAEWKVYQRARGNSPWTRDFTSAWQRVNDAGPAGVRYRLAMDFFCGPGERPVASVVEIVERLEDEGAGSVVKRRRDY